MAEGEAPGTTPTVVSNPTPRYTLRDAEVKGTQNLSTVPRWVLSITYSPTVERVKTRDLAVVPEYSVTSGTYIGPDTISCEPCKVSGFRLGGLSSDEPPLHGASPEYHSR
jgi:hypothetical protein